MRKHLYRILQYNAKRSLLRDPGVTIHPSSRVDFRRIRIRPGGTMAIGEGSIVEGSLVHERSGASIVVGRHTFIGNSTIASAGRIVIGDDVLISWGCSIVDHNSHAISWSQRSDDVRELFFDRKDWTNVPIRPVTIGDKCWIGLHAVLLKGVTIGEGSIVGAGSVVTKNIPPWCVAAGNPARILREIPTEER